MSQTLPYRVSKLSDNTEVWIGKDAKSNDLLTFEYSNLEEWWCHVGDYPGSHILIKSCSESLSENIMNECAVIAVKYSKAKKVKGRHNVTFCKCFQVGKQKRAVSGMVYLTGELFHVKV